MREDLDSPVFENMRRVRFSKCAVTEQARVGSYRRWCIGKDIRRALHGYSLAGRLGDNDATKVVKQSDTFPKSLWPSPTSLSRTLVGKRKDKFCCFQNANTHWGRYRGPVWDKEAGATERCEPNLGFVLSGEVSD